MSRFDFSGWATKNDITCSDGRVIRANAFIDNDGAQVPLVWQHGHSAPDNVLGHALLENRQNGVYAYCTFNKSEAASRAKELVRHGDVNSMSIYANRLSQKGPSVTHGNIVEVSLVLSGANPGALIENVALQHSDGSYTEDETEAVIYSGLTLKHSEEDLDDEEDMDEDEMTVGEAIDSMTDAQREAMYAVIGEVLEDAEAEGDDEYDEYDDEYDEYDDAEHMDGSDHLVHSNVFEGGYDEGPTLSHAEMEAIVEDAKMPGMTLRSAALAHAQAYGIKDPSILFPDATNVDKEPQRIGREQTSVQIILNGCKHSPFSRVKTQWSDLTPDSLRAKGYVKASMKTDVVYEIANRKTLPTTIYVRTKMDRDDILDITDFDAVNWIKQNLRTSLDEELARAILIGDGRAASAPEKIKAENIRPIIHDDDLFAHKVTLPKDVSADAIVDTVRSARKNYKGSGSPTLFTTNAFVCKMLELKDKNGRYIYETVDKVASALNVKSIVECDVLDGAKDENYIYHGAIVNLADYTIGADKGGEVNFFTNFDIDFNQEKYLYETRVSGALVKYKSALVLREALK